MDKAHVQHLVDAEPEELNLAEIYELQQFTQDLIEVTASLLKAIISTEKALEKTIQSCDEFIKKYEVI